METPEQQLAGLSPQQRRLVERWLRQEQAEATAAPPSRLIPRRQATDATPLSFAQQRLWFLHQLEPLSPAYHFRTVIRLLGHLDIAVLARSLNAIIERHEALRTTFRFADGQLRQLIAPRLHLPLPLLDLGCLPPNERAAQIQRLALQQIAQPYRYTGQTDIVVGSPIANRTRREIEGLIGFFVNTLVLRADLTGNPPFRDLLTQLRAVCLHAYAHQDLPFERLVEELHLERDLSRHPLFQVMFALQNTPMSALELPGLTLLPLPSTIQTAKFDLTLSLTETSAGLVGAWEYNTDLFECATITRMTDHFQMLLDGVVADPERRLADLPLLTEAERQMLVTGRVSTGRLHTRAGRGAGCTHSRCCGGGLRRPTNDQRPTTNDQRPTTSRSPLHPFTPSPLQSAPELP